MSKTIKIKLLLSIMLTFYFFIAYPVEAKSLKIGEVYRSLDDRQVVEVVSNNELEITKDGDIILGSYSFKNDKLRVVVEVFGTKKVGYFKLTKEGLIDEEDKEGEILYSKTAYPIAKQKALGEKLLSAAKHGDIDTVKTLLKSGADVNVKNKDGRTALMEAAFSGHTEIVKLLIAKGADMNAKNKDGGTALIYAAWQGHIEIAKLLIDKSADVNAKDNTGWTALMKATTVNGHTEIVKLLIDKGADIDYAIVKFEELSTKDTEEASRYKSAISLLAGMRPKATR